MKGLFLSFITTIFSYIPGVAVFRPSTWCEWEAKSICPNWLTRTLRKKKHLAPDDQICKVEVQELGEFLGGSNLADLSVSGGYMGLVSRLKLHYTNSPVCYLFHRLTPEITSCSQNSHCEAKYPRIQSKLFLVNVERFRAVW